MLALCGAALVAQTPAQPPAQTPGGGSGAGSGSEDEFFSSPDVEVKPGVAENKALQEEIDKQRTGLSGVIEAQSGYTVTRAFAAGTRDLADNPLSGSVAGDFLIDVRLKPGYRAFFDLNIGYLTTGTLVTHNFSVLPTGVPLIVTEQENTLIGLKEAFVDFNIANAVYFRAGKQVLQWGTGYFWNPTDLINIEHKAFANLDAFRQGVFGLRSDVVFARELRLYTFLNADGIENATEAAFAARAEALAGSVELGASGWFKGGKIPVFGADISAPLPWSLNLTGEASFASGDNQAKMHADGSVYQVSRDLVVKSSVGLSRTFDAWNVVDRIGVTTELFYNGSGYEDNMFQELSGIDRARFFGGTYHLGYYGKYYAAAFVTVNKFLVSDMTLGLSGIANFSDMSGIALVSLSISPVDNFTLSLQVSSYLGPDNSEYTATYDATTGGFINNLVTATVGAKVAF